MLNKKLVKVLADGRFHSGSEIGELLSVSRAAVWKQIKKLDGFGITVHAVPGKGYQIPGGLNLLNKALICDQIEESARQNLYCLKVLDSTVSTSDTVVEQLEKQVHANETGLCVCVAESQAKSRPRYGKAPHSTYGADVYLSAGMRLTYRSSALCGVNQAAVVAVLESLEGRNHCLLKWPSEIVVRDKRLASVRAEVTREAVSTCNIVVSVEIHVKPSVCFVKGREDSNANLQDICGKSVERNHLTGRLISTLSELLLSCDLGNLDGYMEKWIERDLFKNRVIQIAVGDEFVKGWGRGVDQNGRIQLETQNGIKSFSGGEIMAMDSVLE